MSSVIHGGGVQFTDHEGRTIVKFTSEGSTEFSDRDLPIVAGVFWDCIQNVCGGPYLGDSVTVSAGRNSDGTAGASVTIGRDGSLVFERCQLVTDRIWNMWKLVAGAFPIATMVPRASGPAN